MSLRNRCPWRIHASAPSWWFCDDGGFEDFSFAPLAPCWKRPSSWDLFPDFDRMVTFVDRGPAIKGRQKCAPKKVEDKTIGHASNDKIFAYNFDLTGFAPKDIKVKTVGQKVVVEAEHEENDDDCHSFSHRHYRSSLMLPSNADSDGFKSTWNNEGVLSISVPLNECKNPFEREVLIQKEEQMVNHEPKSNESL